MLSVPNKFRRRMGNMKRNAVHRQLQPLRKRQQIGPVFRAEISIAPIGNLHLPIRPGALVLVHQGLEVALLIASDHMGVGQIPNARDTGVRLRIAQAIVSDRNIAVCPLRFGIGQARLLCHQIPMNTRNKRKFHSYSPIFYSWFPICKDDK